MIYVYCLNILSPSVNRGSVGQTWVNRSIPQYPIPVDGFAVLGIKQTTDDHSVLKSINCTVHPDARRFGNRQWLCPTLPSKRIRAPITCRHM